MTFPLSVACKPRLEACSVNTPSSVYLSALLFDVAASITLMVIGILSLTGCIAVSPAAGWGMCGAGLVIPCLIAAACVPIFCSEVLPKGCRDELPAMPQ